MLNTVKYIVLIVSTLILFFACKKEETLQQFMVSHQENPEVISIDLTADLLLLKDSTWSKEEAETFKSIKKTNILIYKIDTLVENTYQKDYESINKIFLDKKYVELMRMGKGGNGIKVYSVGNENEMNELIAIGMDEKKGWAIVRVLGNDMQPDKLLSLFRKAKFNQDGAQFEKIKEMFGEMNP